MAYFTGLNGEFGGLKCILAAAKNREAITEFFVQRWGKIFFDQTVLWTLFFPFFFKFCFLNALQSDDNSNTVYGLGQRYILGFSQRSF